jgi:hypothetical protein
MYCCFRPRSKKYYTNAFLQSLLPTQPDRGAGAGSRVLVPTTQWTGGLVRPHSQRTQVSCPYTTGCHYAARGPHAPVIELPCGSRTDYTITFIIIVYCMCHLLRTDLRLRVWVHFWLFVNFQSVALANTDRSCPARSGTTGYVDWLLKINETSGSGGGYEDDSLLV